MNIALKKADEAAYWLELLHESGFLESKSSRKTNDLQEYPSRDYK